MYYVKSSYHLCVEELVDTSHIRRLDLWSGIWRALKGSLFLNIWKHYNLKSLQDVTELFTQVMERRTYHLTEDWMLGNTT